MHRYACRGIGALDFFKLTKKTKFKISIYTTKHAMPRYSRKTIRVSYGKDNIKAAVKARQEKNLSLREASDLYEVPKSVLDYYTNKKFKHDD